LVARCSIEVIRDIEIILDSSVFIALNENLFECVWYDEWVAEWLILHYCPTMRYLCVQFGVYYSNVLNTYVWGVKNRDPWGEGGEDLISLNLLFVTCFHFVLYCNRLKILCLLKTIRTFFFRFLLLLQNIFHQLVRTSISSKISNTIFVL